MSIVWNGRTLTDAQAEALLRALHSDDNAVTKLVDDAGLMAVVNAEPEPTGFKIGAWCEIGRIGDTPSGEFDGFKNRRGGIRGIVVDRFEYAGAEYVSVSLPAHGAKTAWYRPSEIEAYADTAEALAVRSLQLQLGVANATVVDMRSNWDRAMSERDDAKNKLAVARATIDGLEKRNQQLVGEIEHLRATVNEARRRIGTLQSRWDETIKRRDEVMKRGQQLHEWRDNAMVDIRNRDVQIQQLREELGKAHKERDAVIAELAERDAKEIFPTAAKEDDGAGKYVAILSRAFDQHAFSPSIMGDLTYWISYQKGGHGLFAVVTEAASREEAMLVAERYDEANCGTKYTQDPSAVVALFRISEWIDPATIMAESRRLTALERAQEAQQRRKREEIKRQLRELSRDHNLAELLAEIGLKE